MSISGSIARMCASWMVIWLAAPAGAIGMVGIERFGQYQVQGTLYRFDSATPGQAQIVGPTGLREVGAVDFLGEQLWAVADASGVFGFYRVDPMTGASTLVSSTTRPTTSGWIYGGSFDREGRLWLALQSNPGSTSATDLLAFDPSTGQELITFEDRPVSGVVGGIAFVGAELYAMGSQRFGTFSLLDGSFAAIPTTGGHPCGGGSMGFDFDAGSGKLLFTCSIGAAPGPDSRLFAIDPLTGVVTVIGDVVPPGTLDAIAVVPEPASALLLALGLAALARRRARRGPRRPR